MFKKYKGILDPKSEATIVPEEPKVTKKAGRKKAGSEEQTERANVVLGGKTEGALATPLTLKDPKEQEALERLRKIKAGRFRRSDA